MGIIDRIRGLFGRDAVVVERFRSGEMVYHRPGAVSWSKLINPVRMSRREAREAGAEPCEYCFPDEGGRPG